MTNEDLSGGDSKLLLLTQPKILRWDYLDKNGKKAANNGQATHMAWETALGTLSAAL